jgi:hypothetical protein
MNNPQKIAKSRLYDFCPDKWKPALFPRARYFPAPFAYMIKAARIDAAGRI